MVLKNLWSIDDPWRKKKDLWTWITERNMHPQRASQDQRALPQNPPPQGSLAINKEQDLDSGLISSAERSSTPF